MGIRKLKNVISFFDGMSCGQITLNRISIEYDNYFASEINKHAITVTQANYPNTIQISDISKISYADGILYTENGKYEIGHVDLVMGGSPCTNLSFAGKQQGLRGETLEEYLELKESGFDFGKEQSHLFWEYIRLINEINPTYFLLENVRMKKYWLDIISKNLGVEPIKDEKGKPYINSALVSAQNRIRSYWTNIPNVGQPEDKGILLKDIVHENVDTILYRKDDGFIEKQNWGATTTNNVTTLNPKKSDGTQTYQQDRVYSIDKKMTTISAELGRFIIYDELEKFIVPFDKTLQILDKEVEKGKVGYFRKDSQANSVYYIHGKAVTLTGESGGGAAKMEQYLMGCITPDRVNKRQNGQRFNNGNKFYTLTLQDRHGVLIEGYIRKLTPIECERLQTVEDNYTNHVSQTQRYKLLGNGWTVDVITHILKNII